MAAVVRAMRRSRGAAALFAALATGAAWAPPAAAEGVFAGVCTMRVSSTFSAPVTTTAGPRSMQFVGSGTCVVNGVIAPFSLFGTLSTTAFGGYSCAGGLATGTGVVHVEVPGFPDPLVQLTLADNGGVGTLVVVALVTRFDGVASLARSPVDTAACASGGTSTFSSNGAMPFQDPILPVVSS